MNSLSMTNIFYVVLIYAKTHRNVCTSTKEFIGIFSLFIAVCLMVIGEVTSSHLLRSILFFLKSSPFVVPSPFSPTNKEIPILSIPTTSLPPISILNFSRLIQVSPSLHQGLPSILCPLSLSPPHPSPLLPLLPRNSFFDPSENLDLNYCLILFMFFRLQDFVKSYC